MPAWICVALTTHDDKTTQCAAAGCPSALSGGWIGDYLHDPGGTVGAVLTSLREWAITHAPIPALAVAVGGGALVIARRWWAHRCHDRFVAHARIVTVLSPPTVDPAGGPALWSYLVGLLRPRWRRWWRGQPPLAYEYVFSAAGVAIRMWVPGVIPPGLVERAVQAAWPGAHIHTTTADPPIPAPGPGQRRVIVGGELRLARPEALPIRTDFDADPLRTLIGASVGLGGQEYACVQILTRPVTGRRVAHARRAAHRVHPTRSTPLIGHLLDLITPRVNTRRPPRTPVSQIPTDPQTSLEHTAQNRVIITK